MNLEHSVGNLDNVVDTDSYKVSHWLQTPEKTEAMFDSIEARKPLRGLNEENELTNISNRVSSFGWQYIVQEQLSKPMTIDMVDEMAEDCELHGEPFNYEGFKGIIQDHGGYWPVSIKVVPEGLRIPYGNPLVTTHSTDPKYSWAPGYVETQLLRGWYPCSVATLSASIRDMILGYLHKTSEDPEGQINFKLHDFGSRGASSRESAMIGGMAHLSTGFMGTDTMVALRGARKYYGERMAGFSIPASEHSTVGSWCREGEVDFYRHMLRTFGKAGKLFACVSDTYDIYYAAEFLWGGTLRQEVIDSGATVIIRPDSGDPVTVICALLDILEAKFGSKTNWKGYKVLNYVRLIQGDGVNYFSIKAICEAVIAKGYSIDNIAFGMGGALLQKLDRDSASFAMKCSQVTVDSVDRDVYKSPITDPGKKSKRGVVTTVCDSQGNYKTVQKKYVSDVVEGDIMEEIYRNGDIPRTYAFNEVRSNAAR